MSQRYAIIIVIVGLLALLAAWPFIGQTEPTIDPSAFQPVVVPQPEPIPDIGALPAPPLPAPPSAVTPAAPRANANCCDGTCPVDSGPAIKRPSGAAGCCEETYYRRGLFGRRR